ncbi:aminotransferase class I/II-fold pyridoxal phosphate-dependent enzyme [Marinilabiliaceae bacterium JC017]|nr:aminotransferase class I/II-fold pyridoxal phosphate-dependent enzyme [Marinilabiliaceae bacterium JC017]
MKISSKYLNLELSYFAKVRKLIAQHNALNMAEGYSGFHCSSELIKLVQKYLSESLNQFAPVSGEPLLRHMIAEKVKHLYGHEYDENDEVTVTAGSAQGVFTVLSALIKEGDEVIVFEPACLNYVPAIQMNGGQPVFVPLKSPDFHVDWEEVQKVISNRTRMIIVNSPHNPTGATFNELDMLRLQKIINGTKIIVLSDETFEHIIFDAESHQSMALYPKLAERSVIVSSFGETFHVTGWQIGYCLAPAQITKEIRTVQEVAIQSVNSPFQLALAEFLHKPEEYMGLRQFYQQKRDLFNELMEPSRFKPILTKGTFFEIFCYDAISDQNDREFAVKLLEEQGVAATPVSVFFHEKSKKHLLRFNFAKPDELLRKVADRLCKL